MDRWLRGLRARLGESRVPGLVMVVGLLGLALLTHWGYSLQAPFINDDYIFLDRTRHAPFLSLWGTGELMFGWWRPLSREFHYWSLQRLFGVREMVFHLVNGALWIAVLAAYFALGRRIAGSRQAVIATAGVAALSAWAVPVMWVAGAQETWMLLFAVLAIHAFIAGHAVWATLAYAAALLSKETAAVVPAIAFVGAVLLGQSTLRAVFTRLAPMAGVAALWAFLHPALRDGGLADAGEGVGMAERALRTLATLFNLDRLPDPTSAGAGDLLVRVLPAFAALSGFLIWGFRRRTLRDLRFPRQWTAWFGSLWALFGWAPALWAGVGWHSYYTLLGALGAWLALATLLVRRPAIAALVVGMLCLLRAMQATTPSFDWGTEWYQNRAGLFLRFLRSDLKRHAPAPAPGTRFFFAGVPSHVGFLTEGGPALRVWYADTTLRGAFLSDYTARAAGARAGADRFFRYDSTRGWVDMVAPVAADSLLDPNAALDRRAVASALARAGDWTGSARALEPLAAALPDSMDLAADAGVSFAMAGDSASAARWFALAAQHPMADDTLRQWAREFARYLSSPP